jgi:hypothetical protein
VLMQEGTAPSECARSGSPCQSVDSVCTDRRACTETLRQTHLRHLESEKTTKTATTELNLETEAQLGCGRRIMRSNDRQSPFSFFPSKAGNIEILSRAHKPWNASPWKISPHITSRNKQITTD